MSMSALHTLYYCIVTTGVHVQFLEVIKWLCATIDLG